MKESQWAECSYGITGMLRCVYKHWKLRRRQLALLNDSLCSVKSIPHTFNTRVQSAQSVGAGYFAARDGDKLTAYQSTPSQNCNTSPCTKFPFDENVTQFLSTQPYRKQNSINVLSFPLLKISFQISILSFPNR